MSCYSLGGIGLRSDFLLNDGTVIGWYLVDVGGTQGGCNSPYVWLSSGPSQPSGSGISTLEGQMTTANSNISTLQGQMTTANSNISTLSGNDTTLNDLITGLRSDLGRTQTAVAALTAASASGGSGGSETVAFSALDITAGSVGYVYAWGLAAVLVLWMLGYGVSAARSAVRKL